MFALLAKCLNPPSTVVAMEPVQRVCARLLRNIELNGYDIIAVEKAASNFTGTAVIQDPGGNHVYTVTVNGNILPESVATTPVEIQTMRLDELLAELHIPRVDVVK